MIGDEPRGLRRRDLRDVRRREIRQLADDKNGGRRWFVGAAVALTLVLVLIVVLVLLDV